MSLNGTTLSKEGLEYLCGLINKIVSSPKDLLDDINLATNTTFSSARIYYLIDNTLQQANTHAEALCNALTKLTAQKTTVKPTLSNSEKNVIYLYSSDGNAPFEQYLKISNAELIDLGSTSISLNDYLTITDAVATYCKKTDFDALKTEVTNLKTKVGTDTLNTTSQDLSGGVNELKTDLTTHTNDTDIHITTAERDKWNEVDNKVDKTDIVSVLDSTVTNNQLVDGKTLVDKFNSIEDNFSRRYDFDNIRHKRTIDRRLAIKTVIDTFKKDGASITSIDYYKKNSVFIIRYNQGYYYTYIMTSYFNKVFILEYSVYSTDMILWVEDETGELYIRGTIPITGDVIRFVNPFTTNKDKYKLYEGKYTIDENTKTCTLTVSIDCLSPASVSTDVGSLNTLNFKTPSSPRTFDLKAEDDSTNIMRFYLGSSSCQVWLGTAGKRYTGTVTYTIK